MLGHPLGDAAHEVQIGFDNIISRSKPVTITRDFDSPHRLGLFGITGDVNVVSKQLSDLFIEEASEDGLGVSFDMAVNASLNNPTEFDILAKVDKAIFVQSLRFFGQGNGIKYGNFLNLNNTISNGLLIEIKSENIITQLPLIKSTEDFKNKFAFASGANGFTLDVAAGRDDFLAVFDFGNPFLLEESGAHGVGNDDYIKIIIQDNLQSVGSLRFSAKGFEKDP